MITASGCIFLALDTGRVLLQQRSGNSSHPRTWGFFGGKAEKGESPFDALTRELEEEIGFIPDVQKIHPLHKFTSPDKRFEYHSYCVTVYEEFVPQLNNESDGYCWVKMGNWPRPLHPGVKAQLYNKSFIKKIKTIHETSPMDGSNWLDTFQ